MEPASPGAKHADLSASTRRSTCRRKSSARQTQRRTRHEKVWREADVLAGIRRQISIAGDQSIADKGTPSA